MRPEVDQLDRVVQTSFERATPKRRLRPRVTGGGKNYYNARTNGSRAVSRWEYASWWRVIFRASHILGLIIPLAARAFFRRPNPGKAMWLDAHNVTEDARPSGAAWRGHAGTGTAPVA